MKKYFDSVISPVRKTEAYPDFPLSPDDMEIYQPQSWYFKLFYNLVFIVLSLFLIHVIYHAIFKTSQVKYYPAYNSDDLDLGLPRELIVIPDSYFIQ